MKRITALLGIALLCAFGTAQAQNCTITLDGNDRMQFDKKSVSVSASCPEITVELVHSGALPVAAMGHNVVITETPAVNDVAQAGIKAGAANGYVPADDARILVATDMIGGGESTSATFPGSALTAGGDYTFFCSFPGHSGLMRGVVEVTP
ncbi:MAG: azurin [Luteimonas sp.]